MTTGLRLEERSYSFLKIYELVSPRVTNDFILELQKFIPIKATFSLMTILNFLEQKIRKKRQSFSQINYQFLLIEKNLNQS